MGKSINKKQLKLISIIALVVLCFVGMKVYKKISIKNSYKDVVGNYEWVKKYSTQGYKDLELVLVVNDKYNSLSYSEKKLALNKIFDRIMGISYLHHDNLDSKKVLETEKIIVKNDGKIEKYNSFNLDDLGEYKDVLYPELGNNPNSSNSSVSSSGKSTTTKFNDTEIIVYVKYCVKQKLKVPSTAKFPSINEFKITEGNDGISVTGYVDAENSFGAKVRTEFLVLLDKTGNNCLNVTLYE